MLYFDSAWRYASPAEMPSEIIEAILTKVIAPAPFDGPRQDLLEIFKRRFAHAQGQTASRSSSESWAESDLHGYMRGAAANAPLFVEALHDALMDLYGRNPLLGTPPWAHVNSVLAPSGYAIQPPNLVVGRVALPVQVPQTVPSLDAEANELVQRSLAESESLLNNGKYRLAVQEILWLLETVSTAFLELTRFRGHLFFGTGGVHHAETSPPVPGGIPGTDDRTGACRAQARGTVEGVRTDRADHLQLGRAGRSRHG